MPTPLRVGAFLLLALAALSVLWWAFAPESGGSDRARGPSPDVPSDDPPSGTLRGDGDAPAPPATDASDDVPADAFVGIVLDARTGVPVEGATVSAAKEDPACRHRRLDLRTAESDASGADLPPIDVPPPDAARATTTGPDGRFRLAGTPREPADVVARKPGFGFACAAGTLPGNRLVLRVVPGGPVRGMVRRAGGRPIAGALAFLHERTAERTAGALLDATTTDRLGAFEFRGVAPGRYVVEVRHGASMSAVLDDVEPSLRAVAIVLSPALRVWLEVASEDGALPEGATAVWRLEGQPWREGRVALVARADGPRPAASGATWARVSIPCERSQATLSVVAPGFATWTSPPLALPPEGGETTASVSLEPDPTVGTLRVALEDAAGKRLRFADASARAVLRSADTGVVVDPVAGATLDPWVRRGLAAGTYRLDVSSPLHAPATIEVDVRPGDDLERTVRLGAPARLRVRIEAPERRRVRFRLTRDERPLVAYADDARAPSAADPNAPTFFANEDGVLLTGLSAGTATVEVVTPDLVADPISVTLVAGETREVRMSARAR